MNHYDAQILHELAKGIHKFEVTNPELNDDLSPYVRHSEMFVNDIPVEVISIVMYNILEELREKDKKIAEQERRIEDMKTIVKNL